MESDIASPSKGNARPDSHALENTAIALGKSALWSLKACQHGLSRVSLRKFETYSLLVTILGLCALPVLTDLAHVRLYDWAFDGFFSDHMTAWLYNLPRLYHFAFFVGVGVFITLFALGVAKSIQIGQYQNAIDELGLQTKKGTKPKVIDWYEAGLHKTKIVVASRGLGEPQYISKKADLSSAFGKKIEKITTAKNPSHIEIVLTDKELTEHCQFADFKRLLHKPYSFVVGESRDGPIVQSILDLPHLLIAGATGGGKSVFFNNVILSLLTSSKNIRFYLLDLKMGVEVAPYKKLANVKIAKTESEAVGLLEGVVFEMRRRIKVMGENEINKLKIGDGKDDLIVVAIDEASVLYGNERLDPKRKKLVEKARVLTDDIAKLARACGIHLIIATQKVKKEIIDTKIQENLEGKMCFKMSTISGSVMVLGNKMAHELPPVKGRAIWSRGSSFDEIQAPFISLNELKGEIELLTEKFKDYEFKSFNSSEDEANKSEYSPKTLTSETNI